MSLCLCWNTGATLACTLSIERNFSQLLSSIPWPRATQGTDGIQTSVLPTGLAFTPPIFYTGTQRLGDREGMKMTLYDRVPKAHTFEMPIC